MARIEITAAPAEGSKCRGKASGIFCGVVLMATIPVTAALLAAPLFGVRPRLSWVICLVFLQITLWAASFHRNREKRPRPQIRIARAAALILVVSIGISYPLAAYHAPELYGLAFSVEGEVYRIASRFSGTASEPIAGGKIHGGNNYRTGTGHLELTVSRQPSEALYLRGFSGGKYLGGEWAPARDEELFSAMEETLGWGDWSYLIPGMYDTMYFEMNNVLRSAPEPTPLSISVRHLNSEYYETFTPYYSERYWGWGGDAGDSSDGYKYLYYEQPDMEVDWASSWPGYEQMTEWYREVRDAYMEAMQTVYTQVPTELLPQMTRLVEENPRQGLEDVSAFILHTLHNSAAYTLTPGWAPLNRDIAEYFLFESGRGYCEHFALAATLLYRMYGIPARYAAGYMLQPSDFEPQPDGTFQATAMDEQAHAWVEIFLKDYGWTPVEVTPAADGSTVASYPGSPEWGPLFSAMELDISLSGPAANRREYVGQDEVFIWNIDLEAYEKQLWVIGAILLYTLLMTPLFLDYRRLRYLKKLETIDCRKVFGQYMRMLHFAGYLQEYDGSEEDFPDAVAAAVPTVSWEEISEIQNIVLVAAYGDITPTEGQEERVRGSYLRVGRYLYDTLNWRRRLLFRYWYIFG